jgi:hypothetical protein
MQTSNTKPNYGQLSKLKRAVGIFHCLVLVKKHNVMDVDSAFAISENMQDIGLETLRSFKKIKIKNNIHMCQLRHKTSEKGPVNSLYLKLFNPTL